MHRAQVLAFGDCRLCFKGLFQHLLAADCEIGVELEVQFVYTTQVGFRNLYWRDLLALYKLGQLSDRFVDNARLAHLPSAGFVGF